jgi:cytosine permease
MRNPHERYQFMPGNIYYNLNIAGVLALALGFIVGYFVSIGIPAINSLLTGFLSYIIIYYVFIKIGRKPEIFPYVYRGGDLK